MEDVVAIRTKRKRNRRRIIFLLFVIAITLVVLIVSTYAWFIGVSVVNIEPFTLTVGTAQSLDISIDGVHWYSGEDALPISRESIMGVATGEDAINAYDGHTNNWINTEEEANANKGLSPVSTSGAVDPNVGRLVIYGKSSLTATKGGYRLISSRIDNYSVIDDGDEDDTNDVINAENDMYITFDLFLRNGQETIYNPTYNELDDEAVYLTTDSSVTAQPSGASTEDYGLANSVRIAFVQVGRVMAVGSSIDKITGINCTTDTIPSGTTDFANYNTGLCSKSATIWEPNDTLHNSNLITFFSGVCKTKSIVDSNVVYSNNACPALENGTAVNTYTIGESITSTDNVDIYDGLNGFTIPNDYKLKLTDTLTDTEKNIPGHDRPTFFSIAPNSITKIRVYIYLEGQDVDNYDLISKGNTINVNFGFTKDIFDLYESE